MRPTIASLMLALVLTAGCAASVGPPLSSDKKFYELTREDLPSTKAIRSIDISVFGVRLGSSYDEMSRAISNIGRPYKESGLSDASTKFVGVYFGEEEATTQESMVVYRIQHGVVQEIFLYGSPWPRVVPPIVGSVPTFRGFDRIAVGNTKTLLTMCDAPPRLSILGREDRETKKDFPLSYGGQSQLTLYEYDKEGITLTSILETLKTSDASRTSVTRKNCLIRFHHPPKPR